jgi:hypothetical protein
MEHQPEWTEAYLAQLPPNGLYSNLTAVEAYDRLRFLSQKADVIIDDKLREIYIRKCVKYVVIAGFSFGLGNTACNIADRIFE